MPEFVEVKVRVDKSQLTALRAEIEKIKGAGVDIKISANGADAASKSIKTFSAATKEAGERSALLNDVLKNAQWYYISGAVAGVTRALKDAVSTLKAVDSELVAIRKTTDYSEEQIEALTSKIYGLASAYGRTADELLNLSVTFARAGFGDQLEEMTELAALLQNVGDIEGKTAARFLLATNAAWSLNSSYDALMQIVDGLNAQTNQAAVDMEALTEGTTVAGSVFANAGESVQTFAGMLGAAVAATTRSGSEVARGLRTIAMTVRQIKGELEDGEIIDEESISDAASALHSVGVSVADANGELRLTSDVLSELAGKWDLLTNAERSYLAQSLAGKRQANILIALMQNWGEVERQMELYANGAGSALRENELYLNSWEAKAKQLSATWTEFISHLTETDTIKGGLDTLTGAVEALDSGVGRFAAATGAAAGSIALLQKGITALKATRIVSWFTNYQAATQAAANGSMAAAYAMSFLKKEAVATLATSPLVWAAAAVALLYGVNKAVDALTTSYIEQKEALDEVKQKYDELYGSGSEYDDLKSRAEELVGVERERLVILEAEAEVLHQQVIDQQKLAFRQWRSEQEDKGTTTTMSPTGSQYAFKIEYGSATKQQADETSKAFHNLTEQYLSAKIGAAAYRSEVQKLAIGLKDNVDSIRLGMEAGEELKDEEWELLRVYSSLIDFLNNKTEAIDDDTAATQDNVTETGNAANANKTLQKAFEEVEKKSSLTYGTLAQLDALYPGLSKKILDANGNLTAEGKAALTSRNAFAELIAQMTIFNQSGLDVSQKIMALQQLAEQAGITGAAVNFAANNRGIATEIQAWMDSGLSYGEAQNKALSNYWGTISRQMQNTEYIQTKAGGGGGTVKTPQQTELDARKETVALLKAELNLIKERGDSTEDQIALMRRIQDALHDEAETMRAIEGESANVKALSAEWWKIENDIADIQEKIAKQLKEDIADVLGGIVDSLQASADAMTQPLQNELDTLNAQRDAVNDRREEEEKILAVQKARIALENAQKERSVRQYNAATGQWEWVANAKNVEQAQKNLVDAENALQKYREEQAYNLQKENLEKQIKSTNSAFDALKDAINEVTQAIKDGKMSYQDAYAYIKKQMQAIYDQYGIDLTDILADSVKGILDVDKLLLDVQDETNRLLLIAKMQANSAEWHTAGEDRQRELHDENMRIGQALGWTFREGDGTWLTDTGKVAYYVGANGAEGGSYGDNDLIAEIRNLVAALAQGGTQAPAISMQASSGSAAESAPATTAAAAQASAPATAGTKSSGANVKDAYGSSIHLSGSDVDKINALAPGTPGIITLSDGTQVHKNADGTINVATGSGFWAENASLYDSGGILRGIGGIKATPEDEMVLPPDMTRKLLNAEDSGAFQALLRDMGIVTAAANNIAHIDLPAQNANRTNIGTQNVNPVFIDGTEIKNVTMGTTIGELAKFSRTLALHRGT